MKQKTARTKTITSVEQGFERALRFLAERSHSEAEVRTDLLHRDAPGDIIDAVLEKLREAKYLNDDEFGHDWALARVENRGYGPVRINQELRAKGIDNRIVDRIVNEIFAAEREKEIAQNVLRKRFKNEDLGNSRALRRAAGYLERRGFSSHVILELLGNSTLENC